ncbi:hypothetical protein ZWY2020_027921 [Hordeum vulgare]|nr:hypothetical protein ZWY2020_027921 [Hordeum vulgare]
MNSSYYGHLREWFRLLSLRGCRVITHRNKQATMLCLKRKRYYLSQMNQVGSVRLRIDTKKMIIVEKMVKK